MTMQTTSDQQLMATLRRLAKNLRTSEVELLSYLHEMQQRQLYALQGYPSLFAYCIKELQFSEGTTCRRLAAARVTARFPEATSYLSDGRLHVTALAMLEKHLTPENHASVLARAAGQTKTQLEWLIAELAPRPDVATTIRRLPKAKAAASTDAAAPLSRVSTTGTEVEVSGGETSDHGLSTKSGAYLQSVPHPSPAAEHKSVSVVLPLSKERVAIKFSADAAVAVKINRARELLAHKFPRGELEHILDAALEALLEDLAPERKAARQEKRQQSRAAAAAAAAAAAGAACKKSTSPSTDTGQTNAPSGCTAATTPTPSAPPSRSRYIAAATKLATWQQAEGQCEFVSPEGLRCTERRALQFDHAMPFALGGSNDAANIRCYCRSHNAFAAAVTYGTHQPWRRAPQQSAAR